MRSIVRGVVAIAVVGVVLVGAWYLFARGTGEEVSGLGVYGAQAFDEHGALPAGPARAIYSPNGSRVAVIHAGRVDLAVSGSLRPVTARGGRVVDAAWFPNSSTLLVAEGPAPTGGLAVVDLDGRVRGTVTLSDPSVGFGSGFGMSVSADGKTAVLTAVVRPGFGAEQRYLVEVQLETGSVRRQTDPAAPHEFRPRHLDDGRVVYSEPGAEIISVRRGTAVVRLDDRRLVADGGDVLGTVPEGATVVDVAPDGRRALVLFRDESQPRLREVRLA